MTRNGSIIVYGKEWPLYEWWAGPTMVLVLSPDDQAEINRLNSLPHQPDRI